MPSTTRKYGTAGESQGFWTKARAGQRRDLRRGGDRALHAETKGCDAPGRRVAHLADDAASASGAGAAAWSDPAQKRRAAGLRARTAPSARLACRTPACLTPEPPFGASRPTAPSEPGWPPTGSAGAIAPGDNRPVIQPTVASATRAGRRPGDVAGPRRDYQADLRSDPAAAFRGDPPATLAATGGTATAPPATVVLRHPAQSNPLMPALPSPPVEAPAASDRPR